MMTCLFSTQGAEAYTVNEVHLKNGDVYDITKCPKNTIIYIDDKTASFYDEGEVTIKGSSEKVWVDISVSKGKTVNVMLADGLKITPRAASAYGTGDNDDTLGWSVAGIYINETKRAGGTVFLTSKKDADVIVESYQRSIWQPVPAIMKNDTKTKLVFQTEDPSNPGTITARIVKGGDFGGTCAIGAYGHGVARTATSSYTVGNIEFRSGTIEAYGYHDGCGIGAYSYSNVKDLAFTGAHVKAFAGDNPYAASTTDSGGAGIGTCDPGDIGTITISGGHVEAYGRGATKDNKGRPLRNTLASCGPGIGVAARGHMDEIKISGGTVEAYGGSSDHDSSESCSGCGIGTAVYDFDNIYGWSSADKITITGGDITARGGDYSCGIGGCVGTITIAPDSPDTELTIDAGIDDRKNRLGDKHTAGAGIGIANNAVDRVCAKYPGDITIKGGDITAAAGNIPYSGYSGDSCIGGGIGPTNNGKVNSLVITGGTIQANGGDNSPGIGGNSHVPGDMGTINNIHISGGTITATKASYRESGAPLAGIGGCKNSHNEPTDIYITGGSIITNGGVNPIGYDVGGQPKNDKGEVVHGSKFLYAPDIEEWTKVDSFTTDPELDYEYGLNDVYAKKGLDDEDDKVITEFWLPHAQDGYICKVNMPSHKYISGGRFPKRVVPGWMDQLVGYTDITYKSDMPGFDYNGNGKGFYGEGVLSIDPPLEINEQLCRPNYFVDDNDTPIADIGSGTDWTGPLRSNTDYTDLQGNWLANVGELDLTLSLEQVGYMISYDKNKPSDASHAVAGMQMEDSTFYSSGPPDSLPRNTYSLPGWTFAGWNTEPDGTGKHYDDEGDINYNSDWGLHLTLYAQWEPKTYTVTFDPGDAAGQSTYTQEFQYDKPQKLTPNRFAYADHDFIGWGTLAFGSFYEDQATVTNRCTINEDGTLSGMTFYAKWFVVDSLVIIIKDNGKTVNSADPDCITLKSGDQVIAADIQKSNYGYYVSNLPDGLYSVEFTGDLAVYEPYGEAEVLAGKTSLYLLNYYTVTAHETEYCHTYFDEDQQLAIMEHVPLNAKLKINTEFSNTTHKFAGYTSSGVEPTWENGDKTKAAQTITVNGAAEIYPTDIPIRYHVAFEQNQPENASHDVKGAMENQTFTYDEAQELSKNAYTLTGWKFTVWNTKADGSGTGYADKKSVKNLSQVDDETVHLYAQWTPNKYNVIFSAASATGGAMDPQVLEYDTAQTLNPNAFERTDWHFTDWNTEPTGGGTAFENKAEVINLTLGKSVTLYAQWEHDYYTVEFDSNDAAATGEMQAERVWTNCGYELPLCGFNKTGYHLKAWTTEPDGSGDSYENGEAVENLTGKGGTITLYAQWEPNKYSVKYDANGGKGTMEDQSFVYDASQDLEANRFTKAHYVFAEWNTMPDGQGKSYANHANVSNLTIVPNHEVTLYAQWEKAKYSIKYDLNGGTLDGKTGVVEMTCTYGDVITLPAPSRKGYTFKFWKGSRYYAGDSYTVSEDHTLTAQWEKDKKPDPDDPDKPDKPNNNGTNTGDESHILLWIIIMTLSLIGLAAAVLSRWRRQNGR